MGLINKKTSRTCIKENKMATKQIVQVFFGGCWEPVPGSYSFWVGGEGGYWVEDKDSNLVAFFSKKQTSAIRIIKE